MTLYGFVCLRCVCVRVCACDGCMVCVVYDVLCDVVWVVCFVCLRTCVMVWSCSVFRL